MNKRNLVIREKTKIAQKLPKDLEYKITNFHHFIIQLRKKYKFPLSHIGNMDETPMNFDKLGNKTVDLKGVRTVNVKSAEHEKTRFAVVLACVADGTNKLKPMVIFKHKRKPKIFSS